MRTFENPIKSILDTALVSIFVNTLMALFLAVLYWSYDETAVTIWFGLFVAVLLYRLVVYYLYHKQKLSPKLAYWLAFAGVVITGVVWVVPLWTFLYHADIFYQFFIGFIYVGLASGAIVLFAADRFFSTAYLTLVLVPLIIWYASFADRYHYIMAIMVAVYYIFLLRSAKRLHLFNTQYLALAGQRERLYDAYKKSGGKFKTLFDHAPVGLFFYDKDLKIKEANKTFIDGLGVPKEKVLGFDLNNLQNEKLKRSIKKPLLKGEPGLFEGPYKSVLSGKEFVLRGLSVPVYEEGEIIGALHIAQDISKEYESRKKLETYANFCLTNPNPVFQIDCESGKMLMENEKAALLHSLALDWESLIKKLCKCDTPCTIRYEIGSSIYLFTSIPTQEGVRNVYGQEITQEVKAKKDADFFAYYDDLTGLPRKKLFIQFLKDANKRAERFGHHNAILFVDVDDFKIINDTYGHTVGDRLLVVLANRIKMALRAVDIVARFSGDEFVILLKDLDKDEAKAKLDVQKVAQKILQVIKKPVVIDDHRFEVSASIGGVIFESEDPEELLKKADIAMYEAKNQGKDRIALFDEDIKERIYYKNALIDEFRKALLYDQFELYFQPQMRTHSHECVSAEALIRWRHPKRGLLTPEQFLPMAEESGLIYEMDLWMLREVAKVMGDLKDLEYVAINVSGLNFTKDPFIQEFIDIVESSGLDPRRIEIELTESMIAKDYLAIEAKIKRFKEMGFRFAIDDFGTGYSSLSHLKNLTLDAIKIDRSFIKDLGIDKSDEVLTKSIIEIAKNFGLTTIAEGVEKRSQLEFLEALGCDMIQGYHIAPPMSLPELKEFFHSCS